MHENESGGTDEPVLRVRGIDKSFGAVQALKDVDLEVRRGEVLALIGDNGAGKSTLINVITGVLEPDSGEIVFEGEGGVRLAARRPRKGDRDRLSGPRGGAPAGRGGEHLSR